MDYEKKYKEALEKARQFSERPLQEDSSSIVEYIFPELKESEDERIRETLIRFHRGTNNIDGINGEKIVAWLEKQGLEYKDGEIVESQKPKFKVGDWVVDEHGDSFIINSIERGFYFAQLSGCCYQTPLDIDLVDNSYHAWTIEDAKDGDMLYSPCCKLLWIYKDEKTCYVGSNLNYNPGSIVINKPVCIPTDVQPATNAQRYLLFQKMKEAGYEWDADKKELKPTNNRFDYENANIQQKDFTPKASTANRQLYNRAILKILSKYVEEYPDIRFGQMLCNLGIGPVFNEESKETYCNLNETINKKS